MRDSVFIEKVAKEFLKKFIRRIKEEETRSLLGPKTKMEVILIQLSALLNIGFLYSFSKTGDSSLCIVPLILVASNPTLRHFHKRGKDQHSCSTDKERQSYELCCHMRNLQDS